MGCARDIVEHAGVPRFFWSDFPLGNSAGKPHDKVSQALTLAGALSLFESATEARTTLASPQCWDADDQWQQDFMNIEKLSAAQIQRLRDEFQQQKQVASQLKRGAETHS